MGTGEDQNGGRAGGQVVSSLCLDKKAGAFPFLLDFLAFVLVCPHVGFFQICFPPLSWIGLGLLCSRAGVCERVSECARYCIAGRRKARSRRTREQATSSIKAKEDRLLDYMR